MKSFLQAPKNKVHFLWKKTGRSGLPLCEKRRIGTVSHPAERKRIRQLPLRWNRAVLATCKVKRIGVGAVPRAIRNETFLW